MPCSSSRRVSRPAYCGGVRPIPSPLSRTVRSSPLAGDRATFSADDVQRVLDQTKGARVVSRVSAIAIETPVRRKQGERFDPVELKKIVALARRDGIRLHLDGARLFLQAAYTGESAAEAARPFDTVYVSLY